MSGFLDRILQLSHLRLSDEDTQIDWARPIPGWGWVLVILFAIATSVWAYRRLGGSRWGRAAVAGIRAIILIALVVLFSGPRLARQTQTVEKDWVVVLADRSASMQVADAPSDDGRTRDQQLKTALDGSAPLWAAMADRRNVLWMGFDGSAFDLSGPVRETGAVPALGEAAGSSTRISHAIDAALRQLAARPVAGVVLLTDGRTSDPPSRAQLDQLRAARVPLFPVPLGSAAPRGDLAVRSVDAPPAAFTRDAVPVVVRLDRTPGQLSDLVGAKVQLIDAGTGQVVLDDAGKPVEVPLPADLAAEPAEGKPASAEVTLPVQLSRPGDFSWAVRVVLPRPDLNPGNDRLPIRLKIVDRTIRVVYFDGYPRWEYRYLKNLLVREKSIRSSALLLASQRRFIQDGSEPLLSLPRTPAEWRVYDTIVLGDLRPEMFSTEQLQQIRDHVARDGAGILWIGGPSATPSAWRGTPLADLIPFTLASDASSPGAARPIQPWLEPVLLKPTPSAARLGVLRLGDDPAEPWPPALSDSSAGWSALRFAQRIDPARLKPAADVIASAIPATEAAIGSTASASPAIITMRFGAGRVVYVATDEIWRWRYGRGETLPERFWLPIIRLLAREGLLASGQPAVLEVSPERPLVDQPVSVSIRLLDQALLDAQPKSLQARVYPAGRPDSAVTLQLTPPPGDSDDSAGGTGGSGGIHSRFAGVWLPTEPGNYVVEAADPLLARAPLSQPVEVTFPDDERRAPQTDHKLLTALARETGGTVVPPENLATLSDLLPNREVRLLGAPIVESIWDKPLIWALLVTLLAVEWVCRRLLRLP